MAHSVDTPKMPEILETTEHEDIRGVHRKFFGVKPESLEIPGFELREVFMTQNHRNTVRGLHFQKSLPQPKIIKVITGSLSIRLLCCDPEESTFGQVKYFELDANQNRRVYIPGKWALGYRALEEDTRVLYMAGEDFSADGDTGIDPFDPALNIDWGVTRENALLSERDKNLQSFQEFSESIKR